MEEAAVGETRVVKVAAEMVRVRVSMYATRGRKVTVINPASN